MKIELITYYITMEIGGVVCYIDIIVHILEISGVPFRCLPFLITHKSILNNLEIILSKLFGRNLFSRYINGKLLFKRIYMDSQRNMQYDIKLDNRKDITSVLIYDNDKFIACSPNKYYIDIYCVSSTGVDYGMRVANTHRHIINRVNFEWSHNTYCMKKSANLILEGECMCTECQTVKIIIFCIDAGLR